MSEPFLGEIKIISWNFPPKGWAFCNGQLLPINQNQALFSLLGTMYGGNGQTTFGLPDFRGRAPMHLGGGFTQGQSRAAGVPYRDRRRNAGAQPCGQCARRPRDGNMPAGNFLANSNVSPYRTDPNTTLNQPVVFPTQADRSRMRTGSRSWS